MLKTIFLIAPVFLFSFTLDPHPAVPITNDASVNSSVAIAGSDTGFMAAWQGTGAGVVTSFSADNGTTWNTPVINPHDAVTIYKVMVAASGSKYVTCWTQPDPGFATGNVTVSVSSNEGATWSDLIPVSLGATANPPSKICASSQGFMATWTATGGSPYNVWAAFSLDGLTWGAPVQVNPDLLPCPYDEVSVAGNADGFMVSWLYYNSDTTFYEGYSSFSSDLGATWGTPVRIHDQVGTVTDITLSATSAGFLATWTSSDNNGFSSFSSNNGASWSSPFELVTGLWSYSIPIISSGTGAGFVTAWFDADGNAGARFSSNGLSWDPAVSVASSVVRANSNFVGVSAVAGSCIFTLWENDSNGYSSYSPFPLSSSGPVTAPSTFFRSVTPNKPGKGLFH